jgi:hypothetical protein
MACLRSRLLEHSGVEGYVWLVMCISSWDFIAS